MAQRKEWICISRDLICLLFSTASVAEPRVVLLLTAIRLEMSVAWVFNERKIKI